MSDKKEIKKIELKEGDTVWYIGLSGSRIGKIKFHNQPVFKLGHNGKVYFDSEQGGFNPDGVYKSKESLIFALENLIKDLKNDGAGEYALIPESVYEAALSDVKEKKKKKDKQTEAEAEDSSK